MTAIEPNLSDISGFAYLTDGNYFEVDARKVKSYKNGVVPTPDSYVTFGADGLGVNGPVMSYTITNDGKGGTITTLAAQVMEVHNNKTYNFTATLLVPNDVTKFGSASVKIMRPGEVLYDSKGQELFLYSILLAHAGIAQPIQGGV